MSQKSSVIVLQDLAYAHAFQYAPVHTVAPNGTMMTTIAFLASWERRDVTASPPASLLELVGRLSGTYADVATILLDEYARLFPVRRHEIETARKREEFERRRRDHERFAADLAAEKAVKAKSAKPADEEVDPFGGEEPAAKRRRRA